MGTPSEITPAPEQPPPTQPPSAQPPPVQPPSAQPPPVQPPSVQPLAQLGAQLLAQQRLRRTRTFRVRQHERLAAPQDGSAAAQDGPASQQLAAPQAGSEQLPAPQVGSQQPRRHRPAAEAESAATRPTTTSEKNIATIVGKRFIRTSRERTERMSRRGSRHELETDPGRLPDRSTPNVESAGRRHRDVRRPRLAGQCSDCSKNACGGKFEQQPTGRPGGVNENRGDGLFAASFPPIWPARGPLEPHSRCGGRAGIRGVGSPDQSASTGPAVTAGCPGPGPVPCAALAPAVRPTGEPASPVRRPPFPALRACRPGLRS